MAINSISSASKGFAGLASGMDTQSIVDAMLSGTQSKIDKTTAQKTTLGYKKEMYHDVIKNLKSLQNDFFAFSGNSKNNILSSSFYNSMSASSSSSAFKVKANSLASSGKFTINKIDQLATTTKMKSQNKAAGSVTAKLDTSKLKEDSKILVTLDGIAKEIKIPLKNPDGTTMNNEDLKKYLEENIKHEFGTGIIVSGTSGALSLTTDSSREFSITGASSIMEVLGLPNGASNKININIPVGEVNFAKDLLGSEFEFSINGTDFKFDSSKSISAIIGEINRSNANVKVSYSSYEDKFVIESTVSGAGTDIKFEQKTGNLLSAMFGVGSGGNMTSNKLNAIEATTTAINPIDDVNIDKYLQLGARFEFFVDGKGIVITADSVTKVGDKYTTKGVIDAINKKLDDEGISASKIKFSLDETDPTKPYVKVETGIGTVFSGNAGMTFLGFESNDVTNQVEAKATSNLVNDLGIVGLDIKLNGTSVNLTGVNTVSDLVSALKTELINSGNASANVEFADGKITISGVNNADTIEINNDDGKLFGSDKLEFNTSDSGIDKTNGVNAKLTVNGVDIERSNNSFTLDGLEIELVSKTTESSDINTVRDTDKIYEGVVKFMDEYNKTIDKIWGMLKEEPDYKEYPPLTDDQKAAMSDREVELWESKSKEGLLRGDRTLELIVEGMRRATNLRVDDVEFSLSDFGISSVYSFDKGYGGKLVFSDSTGNKLKEMIKEHPLELEKLFTDPTNGIATNIDTIINDSVKSTSKSPRSLVQIAGLPGMPDSSSSIYKQTRDLNDNLENLKVKYKLEYNRYWKQYNSMEQMIQNLNSQSSWLMQQFGG